MIAGHYGLAAMAKARAPSAPLWALMLATVWLDVLFVPLFLAGIETIEPAVPGQAGYGLAVIHADWTHSLAGAALLSALCGLAGGAAWGRRAGLALGLVAASHWALDLVVHRADMPLLPGNAGGLPLLGLGLWRVPAASAAAEAALVVAGAAIYWRAARGLGAATAPRANLAAALILGGGLLLLAADVTGTGG
jgi:hypothetical protein